MNQRTVLITGSNRGIGLSLAKQFKEKVGWTVLGTARKPLEAQELSQIASKVYQLDAESLESIKTFATEMKGVKVDLLINNAGIYNKAGFVGSNYDDMLQEFKVNALGPFFISRELIPNLKMSQNPHIVNMTSRMGSIGDNSSGSSYGYRASKAALNALTKSWSIDHLDIPVLLTHPGFIQTGMTKGRGEMTPDECAEKLIQIYEKFLEGGYKSGQFIHRDGQELPW